ncbi:tetratricopeptide repeat protein [Streptomyces sp. Ag109_G2-15]|uniref:tetratricopeptide repeat protein n=1 Tax=Streptomyces sp. Ag109_G2-15 TaxID=1938850 RepID=UPI000BD8F92A|nr:tetratricopeptide repeat protein [Streptomyces sp. Ag109_G2-15]SOE07927.1 Tetratricopeptide repeat-containing protein [Streptomyces sp. Ag109_G2-15]
MDRNRVVAVGSSEAQGSGYVVGPELVLTSAHVVGPEGTPVKLFHPGRNLVYRGTVVWRGTPNGRDDAALALIDDPDWRPLAGKAEPWGRLGTWLPQQECQTWGVPKVAELKHPPASGDAQGEKVTPELKQLSGRINPGSGLVANRYVMDLSQTPPTWTDAEGSRSPWARLSGAALVCDEQIIGVIAVDPAHSGFGALHAVPAYMLHRSDSFRSALKEYGADSTTLEVTEFRELGGVAGAGAGQHEERLLSPAALLEPSRQVVGFHGRKELLQRLEDWCAQDGPGIWLVHAPGGQGKTRLALQLQANLGRRGRQGPGAEEPRPWQVIWPRFDAEPEELDRLRHAVDPVLVVLDLAEIRALQLDALLKAAADPVRAEPFKLLLLARTAGEWWQSARRGPGRGKHLLEAAEVTDLPALLPDPTAREAAYREALQAFADTLPSVGPRPRGDWAELAASITPPELRGSGWSNALTLHMTALADLLDAASRRSGSATEAAPGPDDRSLDAEDRLLNHQTWYWEQAALAHGLGLDPESLEDAMALAMLVEPADEMQALGLLRRAPALEDQTYDIRRRVSRWIRALCPGDPGRPWGTLQPDRLAERLVGRRVLACPPLATAVIDSPDLTDPQAARLLAFVTRAAAHPPLRERLAPQVTQICGAHLPRLAHPAMDAATQVEIPEPLITALSRHAAAPDTTVTELERLADHLPESTYNLTALGVQLLEKIVELHLATKAGAPDSPGPLQAVAQERAAQAGRELELSRRLRQLSKNRLEMGLRAEGLAAAQAAVDLLRPLVAEGLDGARAELAAALNNVSVGQRKLGLRAEAFASAAEAVDIAQAIFDAEGPAPVDLSPRGPRRRLAQSLNTRATAEDDLGRPQDARKTSECAVEHLQELVALGAESAKDVLGNSLQNLSNYLADTGLLPEALQAAQDSVRIYEKLAEDHPDAYGVALAGCVGVHAQRLGELGRSEESLAETRRSVALRRRLASERPKAYGSHLVNGLNSLALELGDAGLRDEAEKALREAVDLCERLVADEPGAFRHQQAMVLHNLANQREERGDPDGAVSVARQAAAIYAALEAEHPTAFLGDVAMSLTTLAGCLAATGRHEEAVAHYLSAAETYRSLAAKAPTSTNPDLALCLNNLAVQQRTLGRGVQALATVRETIELQRPLAEATPDAHLPALSRYCMHEAVCLNSLGRQAEAVAALQRAVDIDERLAERSPARFEAQLVERLAMIGGLAGTRSQRPQGLRAVERALTIRRKRAEAEGLLHDPQRAQLLELLSNQLHNGGRFDESVDAAGEAVAIRRALVERADSPETRLALAEALSNLGLRRVQAGLRPQAVPPLEEAEHELRRLGEQPSAAPKSALGMVRILLTVSYLALDSADAALAAAEEAAEIFERHPAPGPVGELNLAGALSGLGAARSELGEPAEGLPLLERGLEIARRLALGDAAPLRSFLGHQLTSSGTQLLRLPRRLEEAIETSEEAVAVAAPLAEEDPIPYEPQLIAAQANLGICLALAGRADEAVQLTDQALARVRPLAAASPTARALELGTALHAFAFARSHAGVELAEAAAAAQEAVELLTRLAEQEPGFLRRALPEAQQTLSRLTARLT